MEIILRNPEDITVVNRSRKDLDITDEFVESIKKFQINPILLTSDLKLIAGERRLRACQKAGIQVKTVVKEQCTAIELKELELRENLDRKDMHWAESAAGLAELNALKQAEFGEGKGGRSEVGWSLGDTAKLTDRSISDVHRAVKMAEALKAFPELAESKTAHEANKKLKKLTETLAIAELAKRRQQVATGYTVLANENFILGDALAGLRSLQTESINFANVDTPYGIDLTEQKKIASETRTDEEYEEWPKDKYIENITLVANECYRILKPNSWMLFWFGQEWYMQVFSVLKDAGFGVDKIPAIWFGGAGGAQTMAPETNLARCYEQFFVCRKGSPVLVKRGRINVFAFDKSAPQNKIHPTEKPLELMSELYSTFVLPGQACLSPFIGSGNDGRGAYKHGCSWKGWDFNSNVKNRFLLRVEEDEKEGVYGK